MATIDLKYGRTQISFEYDSARFKILDGAPAPEPLTDAAIGKKLDTPVGSLSVEEIVAPGESVLIVVPDATRRTGCAQVINLLVRRLIANGTQPHDIRIIFATGLHRRVTEGERSAILTPFIAQRIKTVDHDPRDIARLIRLGETSNGIPVELNRAVVEHDHIILIGGVTFHYFAGFTGGRKLICPGLASPATISATHKLAFDCESKSRREGVDSGSLEANAVHNAFVEAVAMVNPAFAISTIVDDDGAVVDLYCGDWIASHHAACEACAKTNTLRIDEKRDLVIVSCGGFPHDINLIQAHKALESASKACNEGGTIILVAECADGLGRDDFLKWFDAENSGDLAERLCEKYQVNGQTAWSLLKKAERFKIKIVTTLTVNQTAAMRMASIKEINQAASENAKPGYIVPHGAKILIKAGNSI